MTHDHDLRLAHFSERLSERLSSDAFARVDVRAASGPAPAADLLSIVSMALRRARESLRVHDVIVRVDVADGASSSIARADDAARAIASSLSRVAAASPRFTSLVVASRACAGGVEVVLSRQGRDGEDVLRFAALDAR